MQKRILAITLATSLLAACGNGGDAPKPEPTKTETVTTTPTPAPTSPTPVSTETTTPEPEKAALDLSSLPAPYNTADADKGEKLFRQCVACHRIDDTGKHKTGPNLLGIMGRKAGTIEGFNYSDAMVESGIVWTPETMDKYLANPRAYVPKTRISYAGLRRESDRVDVIAYVMAKSAAPAEE